MIKDFLCKSVGIFRQLEKMTTITQITCTIWREQMGSKVIFKVTFIHVYSLLGQNTWKGQRSDHIISIYQWKGSKELATYIQTKKIAGRIL